MVMEFDSRYLLEGCKDIRNLLFGDNYARRKKKLKHYIQNNDECSFIKNLIKYSSFSRVNPPFHISFAILITAIVCSFVESAAEYSSSGYSPSRCVSSSLGNGDENVRKFRKAKHSRTGSRSKRVLSGREGVYRMHDTYKRGGVEIEEKRGYRRISPLVEVITTRKGGQR